jgi:hypothetical protein
MADLAECAARRGKRGGGSAVGVADSDDSGDLTARTRVCRLFASDLHLVPLRWSGRDCVPAFVCLVTIYVVKVVNA